MTELEATFTTQSQTLSELKAQSLVTNDKVKTIRSDCDAHEQQLQQILTSVILKKNRESTPTAAQVLRNSISQSVTLATSQSGGGSNVVVTDTQPAERNGRELRWDSNTVLPAAPSQLSAAARLQRNIYIVLNQVVLFNH